MPDARRTLPLRPSAEHLRKQAKRMARERGIKLAFAQRLLAAEYGERSWSDLLAKVQAAKSPNARSRLAHAAATGATDDVRAILAAGAPPDGGVEDSATPLWHACASDAADDVRATIATLLLVAGADARRGVPGSTPLHAAAARGPLALVEALIAHGGIEWQTDSRDWSALDAARRGAGPDHDAIVTLLDRPVIAKPEFRAAVTAIQEGDAAGLARLLDVSPWLLHEAAVEPDCYHQTGRSQYFLDPRLFWFVANNPRFAPRLPENIVEMALLMIERGAELRDVQYALELVMTSASARECGLQLPLMRTMLDAGAQPSEHSIATTLAHGELEPVRALLAAGAPATSQIAAALGDVDALSRLLERAAFGEVQMALALATINGQVDTARLVLEQGADPNLFMPVHPHSTPLHQAALRDNIVLIDLLLAHGARPHIRDKIWNATPLDWAIHEGMAASRARLTRLG